jgi:DTW domain-containing protein YfiP
MEVVILRHILERERNSNTGRLAARALEGASLVEYASPDHPWDPAALLRGDTWLLYPRPGSELPERLPDRLLVLDASWSQARRMAQRIPELQGLPTLALPPPALALPRLRNAGRPEQMSTAESVVAGLRALGQSAPADHLEGLLRELVRRFSLPQRRGPRGDQAQDEISSL